MIWILILSLLLCGCFKELSSPPEPIEIEGQIGDAYIPDFIDPDGIGWSIINFEDNGYYYQRMVKTPGYKLDLPTEAVELRRIREILERR